jgi:hypothetical protein
MSDVIEQFGAKGVGVIRSEKGLYNIVRELFGQDTGDSAAKQLAAAWKAASDLSVDLFRQVGGALLKREDWLISQKQAPARVYKAGRDAWVADHLVWLDWDRIRRPDGSRVMPNEREQYLSDVWETISIGGANKIFGGNLYEAIQGEDTNALPEAIRFAKDITPGHSIWYGRLLFQRLMYEVDPRAFARAKRRQERFAEESDTGFCFEPGDTAPERAPQLFE